MYVFWNGKGGTHGISAFWQFSSKTGRQKYVWVPGDPFHTYMRVIRGQFSNHAETSSLIFHSNQLAAC